MPRVRSASRLRPGSAQAKSSAHRAGTSSSQGESRASGSVGSVSAAARTPSGRLAVSPPSRICPSAAISSCERRYCSESIAPSRSTSSWRPRIASVIRIRWDRTSRPLYSTSSESRRFSSKGPVSSKTSLRRAPRAKKAVRTSPAARRRQKWACRAW
ncbi:hypothetical protein STANM309S_02426 [Streptomyces tanashiensis]